MSAPGNRRELERPLGLTAQEADTLRSALGTPAKTLRQVNLYFDAAPWAAQWWSARARWEETLGTGEAELQVTVKGPQVWNGRFNDTPEFEAAFPPTSWGQMQTAGPPLAAAIHSLEQTQGLALPEGLTPEQLTYSHRSDNDRQYFPVGETGAWLGVDETRYVDGSIDHGIELEFSADEKSQGEVMAWVERLFAQLNIPLRDQPVSKRKRARQAAQRLAASKA